MLTGDTRAENVHPYLRNLVQDLVVKHVSRYPITVKTVGASEVRFYDERGLSPLVLSVTLDGETFTVHGHTIRNDRYRENTHESRTKRVSNLATVRKLLKEHVKPFHQRYLLMSYGQEARNSLAAWKHEYHHFYTYDLRVNATQLIEDVLDYIDTGKDPLSWKSTAPMLSPDIVAKCREHLKRKKVGSLSKHVFINPDDTVFVAEVDEYGNFAHVDPSSDVTLNSTSDLPYDLQEKYALLKMVSDKTVVPEIGVRVNKNFVSFF